MAEASAIESFWYRKSPIRWLLYPLSLFFFALTQMKRWLYTSGILAIEPLAKPVLVVGNITVGGTGKTPMIEWLSSRLTAKGVRVGIVSRGYRSKAPEYPHLVSQDDCVEIIGDETFMQYRKLALPMAIGADRTLAVKALCKAYPVDLVISDDGLQHYRMARDFELVMLDNSRGLGNGLSIPFGPLRESGSRLKTVDFIVQNGGSRKHAVIENYQTPFAIAKMEPVALVRIKDGEVFAAEHLLSESVGAVCGIGNPERFFKTLAPLVKNYSTRVFSDHHDFRKSDFDGLKGIIVMTEKDAVKCESFAEDDWYYLKVAFSIEQQQDELLDLVCERLKLTSRAEKL